MKKLIKLFKAYPIASPALIVSLIILFIAILNRYYPIPSSETKIISKPNFVLTEDPIINIAGIGFLDNTPYKNDFEEESIIFSKNTSIDTSKILMRVRIYRNGNEIILPIDPRKDFYAFISFDFKIQNVGQSDAKIKFIGIAFSSEVSLDIRNDIFYNKKKIIYDYTYFNEFEIKSILPDSTTHIHFSKIPTLFNIDSLRQGYLHLLIVYNDGNKNYYDTYYKYKCEIPDYDIPILPLLVEQPVGNGKIRYFINYGISNKVVGSDFIKFIASTNEPVYILSNEEIESLNNRLSNPF
jgi:hypothetical protein